MPSAAPASPWPTCPTAPTRQRICSRTTPVASSATSRCGSRRPSWGACPDAAGPSAIHVAMSNTLNTPVEALETEFPLRVRELALRRGSGGEGRRPGGEGIAREIEALAPMRFTLIGERRRYPPRGRAGGGGGETGADFLNGVPLPGKSEGDLRPGDRLRIETPGGGAIGSSSTPGQI